MRTPTTALLLLLVLTSGCASENPGISPSKDSFYFPTGLAPAPAPGDTGGKLDFLYVTNSNADLKHNGGTVMALDLRKLPADLSDAKAVDGAGLGCKVNRVDSTSWECPEKNFIIEGATLRVGDFPGHVRVSRDGARLYAPVRGNDYLLFADIAPLTGGGVDLRCDYSADSGCDRASKANCDQWDCHSDHKINYSEDVLRYLPPEPFGIQLNELVAVHVDAKGNRRTCTDGVVPKVSCACKDKAGAGIIACDPTDPRDTSCCVPEPGEDHIYLAHLSGGEVSLLARKGNEVRFRDTRSGFFTSTSSIKGGFSIAPRVPGDQASEVYVSSRVDSVLASFVISNNRVLDSSRLVIGVVSPANDIRGVVFAPGGKRLFLVDRLPPSLITLDMTLEDGAPKAEARAPVEVCPEPSLVKLGPDPTRPGDVEALLAYVVCFASNQIYVVDTTLNQVVGEITTGRGPYSLELDPTRGRAYVANFLENTVGVIDLDPSHSTYQRMVLRIGLVTQLVRQ